MAPRASSSGRDEAGLDRLAEPHFVGEKNPRAEPAQYRQRGLELMREEIDARGSSGAQRRRRPVARDQRAKGAAPRDEAHDPAARRVGDPLNTIDGSNDAAFGHPDRAVQGRAA